MRGRYGQVEKATKIFNPINNHNNHNTQLWKTPFTMSIKTTEEEEYKLKGGGLE